ncbi:sigma-70 family RNA polymerase sigma factor [Planctomicrobium piriforme]|uniref:RNA polymerase sigma-70 factor, Rhodopirellula/Verrucomicrobium family n=1 Tax=Planctomicrobium piriforme TaxID=1576369 RepID=A0A1I3KQ57_9PLAN|nr:sigma-70 family RNA polymerase sigma factor [Planctomicrobium piriforme]SFI74639.1 RNA polymerase sigma-70 factor, Rhodopirellula/Verrucomicrobium family [Planctomicrobium piriforme]
MACLATDSEEHPSDVEGSSDDAFVGEFAANQRRIYAYVVSLAPSWDAADEIFQRVSLSLWAKRRNYQSDHPFVVWASGFVRIEVRKYLSERHQGMQTLSDDAAARVEESLRRQGEVLDERLNALQGCVQSLPPRQQRLLQDCYGGLHSLQEVAEEKGITANSLYLQLKRIRDLLYRCVTTKIAAELR